MNCEACVQELVMLDEGLLEGRAASEVEAHLGVCGACRGELEAIRGLRTRLTPAGAGARAAVSRAAQRVQGPRPVTHRRPRWLLPAGVAAAAALAAGIIIPLARPPSASAAPFAAMVKKLRAAGSIGFTMSQTVDGRLGHHARVTVLDARRQRLEINDDRVVVSNLDEGMALVLMNDRRWAVRTPACHDVWNPYPELLKLADQPGEVTGYEVYQGEPVRVVRATNPQSVGGASDLTVWISQRSNRPLKIEVTQEVHRTQTQVEHVVTTIDGFVFDAEYDAELFSTAVPEGYALRPVTDDTTVALSTASVSARNVVTGIITYKDQNDAWPDGLQQLLDGGFVTAEQLANIRCPERAIGFEYYKPLSEPEPWPEAGLLFEALPVWPGGGVICFADGHTEYMTDRERYERLKREARERAGLR